MSVPEKSVAVSSLRDACTMLIEPFFAYADKHSSDEIVLKWKDPEAGTRVELIYKKCISCGKERLSSQDLSNPARMRMLTFSPHCPSCNEQFVMTVAKITFAAKNEGFNTFNQVFNERMDNCEQRICKKEHKSR